MRNPPRCPLLQYQLKLTLLLAVPDPTLAVFSPGSTHPAAILYDALDHFDRKSPKADESIRSIRPELANAVDTCIQAAGRETEVTWQRKLLKVSCNEAPDSALTRLGEYKPWLRDEEIGRMRLTLL